MEKEQVTALAANAQKGDMEAMELLRYARKAIFIAPFFSSFYHTKIDSRRKEKSIGHVDSIFTNGRYYIVSDPPFEIMSGRLFRGQHKRVQTILVYDIEHLSTTALSRMTVH